VNNNNLEKRILIFYAFFGYAGAFYVLILGNMIFNIVADKVLEEKEELSLSNEVGDLELQYLSVSSKIDLSPLFFNGFQRNKSTFAVRKSLGSSKNLLTQMNYSFFSRIKFSIFLYYGFCFYFGFAKLFLCKSVHSNSYKEKADQTICHAFFRYIFERGTIYFETKDGDWFRPLPDFRF
jgi:hypothetical protein